MWPRLRGDVDVRARLVLAAGTSRRSASSARRFTLGLLVFSGVASAVAVDPTGPGRRLDRWDVHRGRKDGMDRIHGRSLRVYRRLVALNYLPGTELGISSAPPPVAAGRACAASWRSDIARISARTRCRHTGNAHAHATM